jgi:hypothetical protein
LISPELPRGVTQRLICPVRKTVAMSPRSLPKEICHGTPRPERDDRFAQRRQEQHNARSPQRTHPEQAFRTSKGLSKDSWFTYRRYFRRRNHQVLPNMEKQNTIGMLRKRRGDPAGARTEEMMRPRVLTVKRAQWRAMIKTRVNPKAKMSPSPIFRRRSTRFFQFFSPRFAG